MAGEKVYNCD